MATTFFNRSEELLDALPEKPNQPQSFSFPKRKYGKTSVVERSCQSSWFKTWIWLHYNEAKDSVHCHLCLKAVKFKHISVNPGDDHTAFVSLLACCRLIIFGSNFFCLNSLNTSTTVNIIIFCNIAISGVF